MQLNTQHLAKRFKQLLVASSVAFCAANVQAQTEPRTAFVHLFEWHWDDIAQECEDHLGPKGFAAVQISPPQKSITGGPWYTRYQPVAYSIEGRSGDRAAFIDMVQRCGAVGVDIYADAVINHMAAGDRYYPEVPFYNEHFHTCNQAIDYNNRWLVQNCDLVGLNDLKTEDEYVRQKIADYMNDLISLGVKGFRIDAAKHMPVADIAAIKAKLSQDVYIFQEVIGQVSEPIQPQEYLGNGDVTEFNFERTMGFYFKGRGPLKDLRGIGSFNGWLNSADAVVFVSNHDDQRQKPDSTLTYKDTGDLYYIAEIFQLGYPYGYPKVMSSYFFEDHDQGPPANGANSGDACGQGWVCEHRWRGIANMVGFRNTTASEFRVTDWWDNGNNQIAFGRGGLGFLAVNREDFAGMNVTLQTGMAAGEYCDIVNGEYIAASQTCDGPTITISNTGEATFNLDPISASAIHVNAKVGGGCSDCQTWDNAFLRGTTNGWGTTAMTFSDGLWRTSVSFGAGDANGGPRFKITRDTNWVEAYPAQDFVIAEGAGTYDVTFNDVTKQITATKQTVGGGNVDLTLTCNNGNTVWGQSVYAVGNIAELGNWTPANAVLLSTGTAVNYPTWQGTVSVPTNTAVEWKCLKRSETDPNAQQEWQGGSNNAVSMGNSAASSTGSF